MTWIDLTSYHDPKKYCTYSMSIAKCGIILMSGHKVHKSTAPTRKYDKSFIIVLYLDIVHIYCDVRITCGYDHNM